MTKEQIFVVSTVDGNFGGNQLHGVYHDLSALVEELLAQEASPANCISVQMMELNTTVLGGPTKEFVIASQEDIYKFVGAVLPPRTFVVYSGSRPGPMEYLNDYDTYAGLETGIREWFADKPATFRALVGIAPIMEKPEPCEYGSSCNPRDPMEGVWELVFTDPATTADELLEAVRQAAFHTVFP
jgi:hypothetical protein